MESGVNLKCQGSGCNASAVKHVVFGLRLFEAPDNIHISEIPYITDHFDLCKQHIDRVREDYVHVTEYELGDCPAHRFDKGMVQNSGS